MIRSILLSIVLACAALAQTPITFQYFYDEAGQLVKVVDSTGIMIEYVYDAVGNMLEIKRSTVAGTSLQIFSVTPAGAGPLTTVTIQGQGFSLTPANNLVRFNGVLAKVLSATATTLVVEVPAAATNGAISISVGTSTATSPAEFKVLPLPVISMVLPKNVLAGLPVGAFKVSGLNLAGSTFRFEPAFAPAPISVVSTSINTAGTEATLSLAVQSNARGRFTVIATSAAGSSDGFPNSGNTILVITPGSAVDSDADGLADEVEIVLGTDPLIVDTDGDGFSDYAEVASGSDPLDPTSTPPKGPKRGITESFLLSALNTSGLDGGFPRHSESALLSALNTTGLSVGHPPLAESRLFSGLNTTGFSTGYPPHAESALLSALNTTGFSVGYPPLAESILFSGLNTTGFSTGYPPHAESTLLSALNATGFSVGYPSMADSKLFSADNTFGKLVKSLGTLRDTDDDGIPDELEKQLGTNPFAWDTDGDGFPDAMELDLRSDALDPDSRPTHTFAPMAQSAAFAVKNSFPAVAQRNGLRPNQFDQGDLHVKPKHLAQPPAADRN